MKMENLNAANFKLESRANVATGEGYKGELFDRFYSEEDDCFAEVFTNLDGSQTLVVGDHIPFDQETEIDEQDKFIASMY
jgi:hypothetical protein